MARHVYNATRQSFGRNQGPTASIIVSKGKDGAIQNYLVVINGALAKLWELKAGDIVRMIFEDGIDNGKPNGKGQRIELERLTEAEEGSCTFRLRNSKAGNAIYLSGKGFMREHGLDLRITASCELPAKVDGKAFCMSLPTDAKAFAKK